MSSRHCFVKLARLDNSQIYEAGLAIVKKEPEECPENSRNVKPSELFGDRERRNRGIERRLLSLKLRSEDDSPQFDSALIRNENVGVLFVKHEPVSNSICGREHEASLFQNLPEQQTFGGNSMEQLVDVQGLQKDPNDVKDLWWDTIPVTKQTPAVLGKKKGKKSTKCNTKSSVLIYRCKLCLKSYLSESFLFEHTQTHNCWIKVERCDDFDNITDCNNDGAVDKFDNNLKEDLSRSPQEEASTVEVNHVAECKGGETVCACFIKLERCNDSDNITISNNDVTIDKSDNSLQDCFLPESPQEEVRTVEVNHVAECKGGETVCACFIKLERCNDSDNITVSNNDVTIDKSDNSLQEGLLSISPQEEVSTVEVNHVAECKGGETVCACFIKLERCDDSDEITVCNNGIAVDKSDNSLQDGFLSESPHEDVSTVEVNHVAECKGRETVYECFIKLQRCDDLVQRFVKGVNLSINDVANRTFRNIYCEDRSDNPQEGIEATKLNSISKKINGENSFCIDKELTVPLCENEGTSTDLKSKKCDICNLSFLNKHDLFCHQKTHNALDNTCQISEPESNAYGEKRECLCNICHKAFGLRKSRDSHMRNHTMTFKCAHCSKKYSQKKSLDAHCKSKNLISFDNGIKRFAVKSLISVEGKTDNPQGNPIKKMPPLILFEHLESLQRNEAFETQSSLANLVNSSHTLDQNNDCNSAGNSYLQFEDQNKLVAHSINPTLFQNHASFQNSQTSVKTPPEKPALFDHIDNVKGIYLENENFVKDKPDRFQRSLVKELPPPISLKHCKFVQSNKTFYAKSLLTSNVYPRNALDHCKGRNKLVANSLPGNSTLFQNQEFFHNIQPCGKTWPEKPALFDQIVNSETVAVESVNCDKGKTNYLQESSIKDMPICIIFNDLTCSQSNETFYQNKLVVNSPTVYPTLLQNNYAFQNVQPCEKTLSVKPTLYNQFGNVVETIAVENVNSVTGKAGYLQESPYQSQSIILNDLNYSQSNDTFDQNNLVAHLGTVPETNELNDLMPPETLSEKTHLNLCQPVKTFEQLKSTGTLIQIQSKHCKKERFLCKICGIRFVTAYFLRKHERNVHLEAVDKSETGNDFEGSLSETPKKPLCQLQTKIKLKKYFCKICCKGFVTIFGQETHMRKEHGLPASNSRHYQCLWCPMTFTQRAKLHAHDKIHNVDREYSANEKEEYVCKVCGKLLGNIHAFAMHSRLHAPPFRTFACDSCKKYFAKKRTLDSHMKSWHNPKNSFMCPTCQQTFATAEQLSSHRFKAHFTCEICLKELVVSKDLIARHRFCHVDETLFHCHQCKETFHTKNDCKNHIFTDHDDRRPYNCHICFRTFDDEQRFEEHFKLHEWMSAKNSVKISISESLCEKEGMAVYNIHWQHNSVYGITGSGEVQEVAK